VHVHVMYISKLWRRQCPEISGIFSQVSS